MHLNIPLILIALFAVLALAGCSDEESQAQVVEPERVVKVTGMQVTPIVLEDILTLPGETEPDEDVAVSSDSAGTVKWLGVEEGDLIKKGAIIARVDVASSTARVEQAKASRDLAAEQLKRRRELLEKGVLAKEEFAESGAPPPVDIEQFLQRVAPR